MARQRKNVLCSFWRIARCQTLRNIIEIGHSVPRAAKFRLERVPVQGHTNAPRLAPVGEADMKLAPRAVRASRTDRRSDRSRP